MLLKNCVYFLILIIDILSVPMLIFSKNTKNINTCKNIRVIDISYIIYLITLIIIIPDILKLDTSFEILFLSFISLVALIIYIISIILCSKKINKNKGVNTISWKTLILLIIPVLLFSVSYFKERYLINNSEIILIYKSSGNGGIGDSKTFAFAINEKYFSEISLGIANQDYSLKEFVPKDFKMVKNILDIDNYNVTIDDEKYISVYKNNKLIHKKRIKSSYYNIDFEGGFYVEC